MKNSYLRKFAERYIADNNINKNTYQVEKAFIDGAKMMISERQESIESKGLHVADVIERAFYAGREITAAKEKGMLFEHVYKEFTDYKKDVL